MRSLVNGASLLVVIAVTLLAGCGPAGPKLPTLYKVTGEVYFDGKPAAKAAVMFAPVFKKDVKASEQFGRGSSGTTDENGKFTLTTFAPNDGVPEGEFQVGVVLAEVPMADPNAPPPPEFAIPSADTKPVLPAAKTTFIIPERYGNPATSGIVVKVTPKGLEPARIEISK